MVRFLALLLVALLLAVLGSLGFTYRAHRPVLVANSFIEALSRDDVSRAYGMTAAPWRARSGREGAAEELRALGLKGAGAGTWPSRTINEERATLEGRIPIPGDKGYSVRVTLLKEDGTWRVLALRPLANPSSKRQSAR